MNTYNYRRLMMTLGDFIKTKTGMALVESNTNGPQPAYPFFSWEIANPHKDIGFTDNVDNEEFEMEVEFTVHSTNHLDALNIAGELNKLFKTNELYMLGTQNQFYVIDLSDIESADNIISIQVERRVGFTVNLRVQDSFADEMPQIDDVSINGSPLSDKDKY